MPPVQWVLIVILIVVAKAQAQTMHSLSAVSIFEEIMNGTHGEISELIAPEDYRQFVSLRQTESAVRLMNDLERGRRGHLAINSDHSEYSFKQIVTDQKIVELTQKTEVGIFESYLAFILSGVNPVHPSFLARFTYQLSATFRCLNPTTLNLTDLPANLTSLQLNANSCRLVGLTGINARSTKTLFSVELSHAAPAGETGR